MSWLIDQFIYCDIGYWSGEKQAATHVSLDQEFDQDLAAVWQDLEEQVVAAANRGVVPSTFYPTQCCLNSQTDNLHFPLAVVEGKNSYSPPYNTSPISSSLFVSHFLIKEWVWKLDS